MIRYEQLIERRLAEVRAALADPGVLVDTARTLAPLRPLGDGDLDFLIGWLEEGAARADGRYETCSAVRALSRVLRPRRYLEIGTRRSWSLAQVITEAAGVQAVVVARWAERDRCAGCGPGGVLDDLRRVGLDDEIAIEFASGVPHQRLAGLFGSDRPRGSELGVDRSSELAGDLLGGVELAVVDGRSGLEQARAELALLMPNVGVGGAIVLGGVGGVDGSQEAGLTSARQAVWDWLRDTWPDWTYLDQTATLGPRPAGAGIAFRVRPARGRQNAPSPPIHVQAVASERRR